MSRYRRHVGWAAILVACAVLAYVVFRPDPLEKPGSLQKPVSQAKPQVQTKSAEVDAADSENAKPAADPKSPGQADASTKQTAASAKAASSTGPQPARKRNCSPAGRTRPRMLEMLTGELRQWPPSEPCGCSVNQLGGLSRRADLLRQIDERGWPVAGLDVGGLTNNPNRRQGRFKLDMILKCLVDMRYAGIAMGVEELQLGFEFLSFHDPEKLPFLSANLEFFKDPKFTGAPLPSRIFTVGKIKIGVIGVFGPDLEEKARPGGQAAGGFEFDILPPVESIKKQLEAIEPQKPDLPSVLLSHARFDETKKLVESLPQFDIVVTAGGPEEPDPNSKIIGKKTLLIAPGQKGKHVPVVGLFPNAGKDRLRYELVDLDDKRFKDAPNIIEHMKFYQFDLLKGENIAATEPPIDDPRNVDPLTGNLVENNPFVGAKVCGECHKSALEVWEKSKHADATKTLKTGGPRHQDFWINRVYDPECIACHVTGWDPKKVVRLQLGLHQRGSDAAPRRAAMRELPRPRRQEHFAELERQPVGQRSGNGQTKSPPGNAEIPASQQEKRPATCASNATTATTTRRSAARSRSTNTGKKSATPGGIRSGVLLTLVFGVRAKSGHLAYRTLRSARAAGSEASDVSHLASERHNPRTILGQVVGPVWFLRAGAWRSVNGPITVPRSSATGSAVCAVGWPRVGLMDSANGEGAHRQSESIDPALWRKLYLEFGGDLSQTGAKGCRIPSPLSVLLSRPVIAAFAERLHGGADLESALVDELHTGRHRVVRYAPLDIDFDERLRVLQVVTSLQRGGAERVTVDLARALKTGSGVHCRIATVGSPTRQPFPAPPGTCDLSRLNGDRAARVAAAIQLAFVDGSDVVHAHLLDGTDLAQISAAGFPILSTVHNTRQGWQAGQADLGPNDCDLVVGCAQAVETELQQTGLPIPLRTVWNGIDPNAIARCARSGTAATHSPRAHHRRSRRRIAFAGQPATAEATAAAAGDRRRSAMQAAGGWVRKQSPTVDCRRGEPQA